MNRRPCSVDQRKLRREREEAAIPMMLDGVDGRVQLWFGKCEQDSSIPWIRGNSIINSESSLRYLMLIWPIPMSAPICSHLNGRLTLYWLVHVPYWFPYLLPCQKCVIQATRIEGPLFHRGASSSTKDYLAAPLPPLHLLLQPPYNIFSQT